MDTFFPNNKTISVDPGYVGIISGDPKVLEQATNAGLQVHTNDNLRGIWESLTKTNKNIFSEGLVHDSGYRDAVDKYITEVIGRPSLGIIRTDDWIKSWSRAIY